MKQGHDEHGAVFGGKLVGVLDVAHCSSEVEVCQGHDLWPGGCSACVQYQRDILRLWLQYRRARLPLKLSKLLDVESYLLLGSIPIAFSDGSVELAGRLNRRATTLVGALGHKYDGRLDIFDVKFEFLLLIGRVKRSGDASLPRGGQEGDDEFVRVGCSDRDW